MRRGVVFALVASAVLLASRRRFRRHLAAAVRLPAAVLVALAALPLDILDDIWGGVTGIASDVKNWVLGLVHHLESLVEGWFGDVWNGLSTLGNWVSNLFDSAIEFAQSIVNNVVGFVRSLFDSIVRWVGEAVDAVYRFVRDLFDGIVHWAEQAVGDLWHWVTGLPKWIWDNLVSPVWDAIMWVWHNVVEPAVDWLTQQIGKLSDFVWGLVKWVFDQVGRLWDWVWKYAARLLAVVEKCFDWLVMLALHGPGWVVQQFTDFLHKAPEWLAHELAGTIAKEGPTIEKTFADWFLG